MWNRFKYIQKVQLLHSNILQMRKSFNSCSDLHCTLQTHIRIHSTCTGGEPKSFLRPCQKKLSYLEYDFTLCPSPLQGIPPLWWLRWVKRPFITIWGAENRVTVMNVLSWLRWTHILDQNVGSGSVLHWTSFRTNACCTLVEAQPEVLWNSLCYTYISIWTVLHAMGKTK